MANTTIQTNALVNPREGPMQGNPVIPGAFTCEQIEAAPYTEQERLQRDRINIRAALEVAKGKISGKQGAAELLGIKPTTLVPRMNSLGIEKPG